MHSNIPAELRVLNQWVCWREGKIPYQVNGQLANVTEPSTWNTFEICFGALSNPLNIGIGFVFTDSDPYSFIDLDNAHGDATILATHLKIAHEFDSYSEVSPSGMGLHIIVKGKVTAGRRRSKVEIYSTARYATMTGNVHNAKPIADYQSQLTMLWEQMGSGPVAQSLYKGDEKETDIDGAIIKRAMDAVNGDRFVALHSGRFQDLYTSQSEADFAYIDIIAFYTQNKVQIARIFRSSALGARDKAKRKDYVDGMINRSFDRMLPNLDFDGFKNALELKLAQVRDNDGNNYNRSNGQRVSGFASPVQTRANLSQQLSIEEQSDYKQKQRGLHDWQDSSSEDLVSSVQSYSEVQSMSGNSSGLSGVSSHRPEAENSEAIGRDKQRLEAGAPNRRNPEVRSSVRQLSQETASSREDGAVELPSGLLGELASFIYGAAPRPVPEVALAAAIGLMAGITGRAYNISGTGLNQYVLLLAMTGAGKEAAAQGINKLMNTIKMQVPTSTGFIGPSEISSGSALFKYFGNHSQSFLSMLGEFGLRLQSMSAPGANGSEVSLRRMFLELYNKSGFNDVLQASIYSKKEDSSGSVASPSFSILGESTPERFYGALTEDMISEGLLPRFLLIEYKGNRPPSNEHHTSVVPSFSLIEKLAALAAQCETVNHSQPRRVINVEQSPEASKMLKDFDRYADNKINGSGKEVIRQLWNRAHLKVLKLSALIAVGENMLEPTIQANHMTWAANMVQADIAALTVRFEAGEIGSNTFEVKQAQEILRAIVDYIKSPYERVEKYMQFKSAPMHNDKVIAYGYLNKRLVAQAAFRNDRAGATVAIKRAIQNLIDSDRLKELGKVWTNEKYGTSQRCFVLADLSILDV